ncbi:MAG TPA: ribonuclease III [Thermoanaerobaculia bacterium]|nr:ribonuclease III [Thermoanaerobaculia bacterium]
MSHVAPDTISEFERIVGYKFQDRDLLARSLTHKSFANERRETSSSHNERLEFLGDTVLGFVIGELIYRSFPNLQEGSLSKIKAHLVSSSTLAAKGRELGIGRFLRMGAGEARSGGAEKLSLLADGFEAIVAAIYLDGGLAAAEAFLKRTFLPDVTGIDIGDLSFQDYKTVLQESAQALGLPLPEYRIVDEYGPDHEKVFVIQVFWNGEAFAYGRGASKREAQRKAAKEALKKLGRLPA